MLDSPHGSHMLVGESRAEEQPPLTLEWAGYPHPSPRPRHRNRQTSLEEPLHGSVGRRYNIQLLFCCLSSHSHLGAYKDTENGISYSVC